MFLASCYNTAAHSSTNSASCSRFQPVAPCFWHHAITQQPTQQVAACFLHHATTAHSTGYSASCSMFLAACLNMAAHWSMHLTTDCFEETRRTHYHEPESSNNNDKTVVIIIFAIIITTITITIIDVVILLLLILLLWLLAREWLYGADHVGKGTIAIRRTGRVPSSAAGTYTLSSVSQASAESWTAPMSQAVVTPGKQISMTSTFSPLLLLVLGNS